MREPDPGVGAVRVLDRRRLLRRAGLLLVMLAAVVLAIVELPGLSALRARFADTRPAWIVTVAALEAATVLGFVAALHAALGRRLRWRDSAAIGTTAQGVNAVVPAGGTGGLAAAAVILTGAGLPPAWAAGRMIALFLITSVATNVTLVIVAGLGVAVGVLPGHASLAASLLPALLAVGVIVGSGYLAKRSSGRSPVTRQGVVGRATGTVIEGASLSGELLRRGDPLLIAGSLGYVLCDLAALAASFAVVGSAALPVGTMILAYTLGQVGSVVSLPGTTEGGLIGVLVLYGSPLTLAVSAVLIYRTFAVAVPLLLGLVGATQLRPALLGDLLQPRPEAANG